MSKTIGQRPSHTVLAGSLAFSLLFLYGFGQAAFTQVMGFLYPIYASFKAIKSERKDDDTQWLTYWVVYGMFSLVESFTDLLAEKIPFYFFLKLGFLFWCFAYGGAQKIYKHAIEPMLTKWEGDIDSSLSEATRISRQAGSELASEFSGEIAQAGSKAFAAGAAAASRVSSSSSGSN